MLSSRSSTSRDFMPILWVIILRIQWEVLALCQVVNYHIHPSDTGVVYQFLYSNVANDTCEGASSVRGRPNVKLQGPRVIAAEFLS